MRFSKSNNKKLVRRDKYQTRRRNSGSNDAWRSFREDARRDVENYQSEIEKLVKELNGLRRKKTRILDSTLTYSQEEIQVQVSSISVRQKQVEEVLARYKLHMASVAQNSVEGITRSTR